VVFTSANGVRYFRELAAAAGADLKPLARTRIAAVGRSTAAAVKILGLGVALQPTRPTAAALARELPHIKNRRILLLRADIAPPEPADILRRRLADVTDLPVYGTVAVTDPDPAYEPLLTFGSVAAHVLASPSAVEGLTRRLTEPALARARAIPAVAAGPTTATALASAGFTDIRPADRPAIESITKVLDLIR
jgi:uroporphyrinogen-III synthase